MRSQVELEGGTHETVVLPSAQVQQLPDVSAGESESDDEDDSDDDESVPFSCAELSA